MMSGGMSEETLKSVNCVNEIYSVWL